MKKLKCKLTEGPGRAKNYREKGEASTREVVRWAVMEYPEVANNRIRWTLLVLARVLELRRKPDIGLWRVQDDLAGTTLPALDSILVEIRKMERAREVVPTDERIRKFHEAHRLAAEARCGSTVCPVCAVKVTGEQPQLPERPAA